MSQAWVLLWLPLGTPSPAEQAHLNSWAQHERVSLRAAQPSPLPAAQPYPSEIVAHIEGELEAAHLALGSGDAASALAHVSDARKSIEAHPELPQSAWLMAEALRLDSAIAAPEWTQLDDMRRQDALDGAQDLEGPRARSLESFPTGHTVADSELSTLVLRGPRADDTVEWDGTTLEPHEKIWSVSRWNSSHHVRVLRRGHLLWAGWIGVAYGETSVDLPLPPIAACSSEDLDLARSPETMSHVRCASWIAARPAASGTIEIARCHPSGCEPFTRWPHPAPAAALSGTREPSAPAEKQSYWGYGFLGVAVAATATAIIWGATREGDSERTVWVYDGIR